MNAVAAAQFEDAGFKVQVMETPTSLVLQLSGVSAAREPSTFLEPIFTDAVREALTIRKELVLDFTTLQRMNSSTVPPILRLIAQAQTQPLRLRLIYDRHQQWQTLSFSVLKAFETIDRRISVSPR